ncbi:MULTISPECIES: type II secretion system F family protein [Rahnella]|uniref:type II secretion system F family protein n=1 Tax=Rahnella TaxID=34037 RepID=UPI001C2529F6|nr:type II secretion system F family protein [Rahnella rivi]MBU9832210.1 type II secretion system F family protein [Rahnella rivi]
MRKFSKKHRLYLYQFCSDMINADLPLYESLLKLQVESQLLLGKSFGIKLQFLISKMKGGISIASVFQDLVPRDELSIIHASERSGGLADGFMTLVNIIEYNDLLMKKLISAVTFPIIMMVLALGVITGYALKVFPAFADVVPIEHWPVITQRLFNFGTALFHGLWLFIILGFVGVFFLMRFMMANFTGDLRNRYLDKIMPFSTFKQISASVFLNNLARMLKNNIPINDSLNILALNANRWLKSHVDTMLLKMTSGENYGDSLNTGLFGAEELLNITLYSSLPSFNDVLTAVSDKSRVKIQEYIVKVSGLLKALSTLILGGCVIWVFLSLYALTDAISKMSQY